MAFDLPFPPFPHDSRDVPFIATPDENNGYTVPSSQYFKKLVGGKYLWTSVSADDPLPTGDAAAQATLTAIQGYVDGLETVLGTVTASPTAYTVVARLKDLASALGEVQAIPTANTLLARIKSIEDKLTAGIPLSGSLGEEAVRATRYGDLAALTSAVVLDANYPIEIDVLMWSANVKDAPKLKMEQYNAAGALVELGDIKNDGSTACGFYPNQLILYGSSIFTVLDYDEANETYKFVAKNLKFAHGVKITASNVSASVVIKMAVDIWGRKLM